MDDVIDFPTKGRLLLRDHPRDLPCPCDTDDPLARWRVANRPGDKRRDAGRRRLKRQQRQQFRNALAYYTS